MIGNTVQEFNCEETFDPVFGATRNPYDLEQNMWGQHMRRGSSSGLRHGTAGWQRLWGFWNPPNFAWKRSYTTVCARISCREKRNGEKAVTSTPELAHTIQLRKRFAVAGASKIPLR
jgi:hypothetical protein